MHALSWPDECTTTHDTLLMHTLMQSDTSIYDTTDTKEHDQHDEARQSSWSTTITITRSWYTTITMEHVNHDTRQSRRNTTIMKIGSHWWELSNIAMAQEPGTTIPQHYHEVTRHHAHESSLQVPSEWFGVHNHDLARQARYDATTRSDYEIRTRHDHHTQIGHDTTTLYMRCDGTCTICR